MSESHEHMVEIGRKGGKRGGPERAKRLSARRRSEIATEGAEARWHSRGGNVPGRRKATIPGALTAKRKHARKKLQKDGEK
jgi:hypothetical protein